jgi:hypothetical protein
MKTKLFLLAVFFISVGNLTSQNFNFNWANQVDLAQKPYLATDVNGNTFFSSQLTLSYSERPFLAPELYVAKYNSSGIELWSKSFKRNNASDGIAYVNDIDTDALGNVYITGYFIGTVDLDPSSGITSFTSPSSSRSSFILKLDANGSFIWAKDFTTTTIGSSIEIYSLAVDTNGNIILTGDFENTVDFDPGVNTQNKTPLGRTDIFIVKLNTNGDFNWVRTIGLNNEHCVGYVVNTDKNGNIYALGNFSGNIDFDHSSETTLLRAGSSDNGYILKYNADGDFVWAIDLKLSGSREWEYAKTDLDGNTYIIHNLGGGGTFDFDLSDQGNTTFSSRGDDDIITYKLDNNGNFVWGNQIGGPGRDRGYGIAVDNKGLVYITGFFEDTIDFDSSRTGEELVSNGDNDILIAQLDVNGKFVTASNVGDFGRDQGQSISIDNNGGIYSAGEFTGKTVDFNPGLGETILNSLEGRIFLLKLSSTAISSNVVSIPDVNFEQYLIDENLDTDATINGLVLKTDIEDIESINIDDKNITDLTGIEGFKSLKELSAKNNQINTINISQNLLLEELFISNNQISAIDVSKNTKLKKLDVGENNLDELDVHLLTDLENLSCYKNQLTTINLISNKKLISFIANENQFTNLNLSANKSLIWLDVEDNTLAHLNVKNTNNSNFLIFDARSNASLTCIEVDDITYSNSNWTQKDGSANFSEDCAPPNNDCAFAIPLIIGQETPGDINSGTFTNATDCVAGTVIADVWYSITVPASGEFSIQGTALGGLLKFAVYESCTSTSAVTCGINVALTNLNPGDVYYLRVWMEEETSNKTTSKINNTAFGTFTLTTSESSVLSISSFKEIEKEVQVFPNPATSEITIKLLKENLIDKIELFNSTGAKVLSKSILSKQDKITLSQFASGVYFLKIKSNNQTITQKLIIK